MSISDLFYSYFFLTRCHQKSVSAKLAFQPRQRVFAKMPGFSAWPAFVVPQEDIPDDVLEAKK